LAWGLHSVRATITHAVEDILELWLKDGRLLDDLATIESLAAQAGVAIQRVPWKTLERLTEGAVHQGVVIRRRLPAQMDFEDYVCSVVNAECRPLLLILDEIQDPQNFGACLRVADGAGADAVLVGRKNNAAITGTVAKAASGALDSVPIIAVSNLARALDQLRIAGLWLVGAVHDAPTTVFDCDFRIPLGVIVGSERKGLRKLTRSKCDHLVSIPMSGRIPSLNVATATAVMLFEARRQSRNSRN